MSERDDAVMNKTIGLAIMVGVFILIVFDSVAFGIVAGFVTYWLKQRDAKDEEPEM